ncbi:LpqB family beta-propeller domain-containing protein [Actinomyces sp. 432]|uniref:LpqB family beta-propeller domain-containing protein n=2 Tax=unclassified Actinomyces TaxID=2609248 RepID=UPI001F3401EC|nr:LpqB family beta-propeller domain-containing protein [Actinomyces sp. 432]
MTGAESSGSSAAPGLTRQMPRRSMLAAMLLGGGALAACTALPTSGEITESDLPGITEEQLIQTAAGPVDGATPDEIVTGFLRACVAGLFDDFATARAFLTDAASASWQPSASVGIYEGSTMPVVTVVEHEVTVTVDLIGTIDAGGAFTAASEPDHACHYVLSANTSGQWRIAELPAGMLLSDGDLSAGFASAPLFFLTPDHSRLVPELRWLPRHEFPRRLIEALLGGPSHWLAAGATTAVPEAAAVGDDGVVVEAGVANVDLTGLGGPHALEGSQAALVVAQIRATLVGAADITQVRGVVVRADGEELGGAAPLPAVDAAPGAVVGMCLGAVVQGTTSTRTTLVTAQTLGAGTASHPTLGADGTVYVLSRSSLLRVPPGQSAADVIMSVGDADSGEDSGTGAEQDAQDGAREDPDPGAAAGPGGVGLLPPVADRHHWVWTGAEGELLAVDDRGRRVRPAAAWLDGRKVISFDVSAESSRIVVRHSAGTGAADERVSVAAITRDEGAPAGLGEPLELPAATGARTGAVVWYDALSIAVLPTAPEGQTPTGVLRVPVGGPLATTITSPAAVAITADRATGAVQLTDAAGRIWQQTGTAWRVSATDVTDIAYPLP